MQLLVTGPVTYVVPESCPPQPLIEATSYPVESASVKLVVVPERTEIVAGLTEPPEPNDTETANVDPPSLEQAPSKEIIRTARNSTWCLGMTEVIEARRQSVKILLYRRLFGADRHTGCARLRRDECADHGHLASRLELGELLAMLG
ncbi:MAG: hypothetical protein RL245_278 [Pseudomonadota bacterium]